MGDPCSYGFRCSLPSELFAYGGRNGHAVVERREHFNFANQNQITDRPRVGDYDHPARRPDGSRWRSF